MVSSLFCLIHPLTADKLLTLTNVHIKHQCSKRYSVIIMTIMGLSPKGKSYPMSFGTHTQGQDQPHVFRD